VKNILRIPINETVIKGLDNDATIKKLAWFSDGYNSYQSLEDGGIMVNDLRFGRFSMDNENADNFVFKFELQENSEGELEMTSGAGGPPDNADGWVRGLWERIKGI
jgi:inner membrane protein